MFTSLSQFYNSDAWRSFRLGVIDERTNKADGVLYCEHCGKPIVQTHDIVAHHKKPLTMANVNDYAISLNPANIDIVCQRSHNEIHNRFGYTAQRKVYIVYGAPCSGKTTFVNEVKGNSDLVVDMDNIWQSITGGERYFKPPALKTIAFAIRESLYDSVKTRAGKWERAYVIAGLPTRSERDRLCERLGAELIHIGTDKQTCLNRLASDPARTIEQKKEWQGYIDKYFDTFQE